MPLSLHHKSSNCPLFSNCDIARLLLDFIADLPENQVQWTLSYCIVSIVEFF